MCNDGADKISLTAFDRSYVVCCWNKNSPAGQTFSVFKHIPCLVLSGRLIGDLMPGALFGRDEIRVVCSLFPENIANKLVLVFKTCAKFFLIKRIVLLCACAMGQ